MGRLELRNSRSAPRTGTAALAIALLALPLAGCGGASSGATKAAACQEVEAVLSDGPDPGADPVGYAEAQIAPLRKLHLADHSLAGTVARLDSAYAAFYRADGRGREVARTLAAAERSVNAVCPGAAP